jgi:hypothetical protein
MSTFWTTFPRLINTLVNPFARSLPRDPSRSVLGWQPPNLITGLEGGCPAWVYCEFPTLASQDTDDTTMELPDHFVLLGMLALANAVGEGANPQFRVQLYDVNHQIDFIPGKAVNFQNACGIQGSILYQRCPFPFALNEPQLEVRIANMSTFEIDVQFAIFGTQGVELLQ